MFVVMFCSHFSPGRIVLPYQVQYHRLVLLQLKYKKLRMKSFGDITSQCIIEYFCFSHIYRKLVFFPEAQQPLIVMR